MYRNDEAASRPNGRAFMSQDPSYLILQEERMRLQKELMKAKENLTIVVQEMIHTEDQLKKKELEVSDLKQRLSNIREETSKNVNTLHQTQKIIDIKDSALLSQSMKEERYLQTITEQKEKIDELQLQISSLNQTNQHLQSQIDQQSEKHDKLNRVLQKENYELKQRLTEIKVKLQKEEVKRTTDMKKIVEERNALQDEIKSLLASDLTRQEKMLLIQSSPFIFSKDPKEREGDDNFNDRLNHSLVVSNTLKLLSSSKERVKSLENENSALKQALLDFGQEAEKEKAVLIKQISNMQKTILELTKQTTSSLEMANGADLKQHEIDSLRMENDQLRMQLVKFETHFSLENERTALEKESSRLDQIMSIPIEMAPQAPIDTDVPIEEVAVQLQHERDIRYQLELELHRNREELEIIYNRTSEVDLYAGNLLREKEALEHRLQDVLKKKSELQNGESDSQGRNSHNNGNGTPLSSPSVKGILKRNNGARDSPGRFASSLTNVNQMLRKVKFVDST